MAPNLLRNIPSVSELLDSPPIKRLTEKVNQNVVVSSVRSFVDNLRQEIQSAAAEVNIPQPREMAERIARWILAQQQSPVVPAINATGVILHGGLGRAPLATEAVEAVAAVAAGYSTLEIAPRTGQPSPRGIAAERLLMQATGAEAAAVVNNNAAATWLTLAALAAGREVIVSRGELVESTDGCRVADLLAAAGCRLREVGTTNKTRIEDYEAAIGADTAALLRVHPGSFSVVGSTQQPALAELAALGQRRNVPVIDDVRGGALVDLAAYGLADQPLVPASIQAGADLVLFSGDRLLGGPQCGAIVGRKALVQKIAQHPLARTVRPDKLTLAALAATLQLYDDPQRALKSIPVLSLLCAPVENLKNRAERLAPQLAAMAGIATAEAVAAETFLSEAPVSGERLATWCIALRPTQGTAETLAAALRSGRVPVFGSVREGKLWLDLRSVLPAQEAQLLAAVEATGRSGEAASEA